MRVRCAKHSGAHKNLTGVPCAPFADTMTTIRVRSLLTLLNGIERAGLKKLLPPKVTTSPTEPPGTRYPAALIALIAAVDKGSEYAIAGHVTESLLQLPAEHITVDALETALLHWCPAVTDVTKLRISKTTGPYLNHLRATRAKLPPSGLEYDAVVGAETDTVRIEGHPDARTATQLFEVKMTGQLKQNWVDFLFQVFAYGALDLTATDVYLVLPLQEIVWHFPLAAWPNRAEFRRALLTAAERKCSADTMGGAALIEAHRIGAHCGKQRTLAATMLSLSTDRPSQIFLGSPTSSTLELDDADVAAAAKIVAERRLTVFVHSAYIINLCTSTTDGPLNLLCKTLQYAVAAGCKGVVVHVGKSTTQPLPVALETMRANIIRAMEYATPTCPLLLETPAGQGTELLCTQPEFNTFLSQIPDPDVRLRACVDTCHIFAAGEDSPRLYLEAMGAETTRLIHFNDSATPCGSHRDCHAFAGQGHIGLAKMTEVACWGTSNGVPMVCE